jgi:hypothetical protein
MSKPFVYLSHVFVVRSSDPGGGDGVAWGAVMAARRLLSDLGIANGSPILLWGC